MAVRLCTTAGTGDVFFAGLQHCGSVWECPECAPRVQGERGAILQRLNKAHAAAGGGLYLLTLTLPHDEGDDLKPLREHVAKAWTATLNGAPWKRWRDALGIVGTVRALEVTHGPSGWHPHIHAAIYTARPLDKKKSIDFLSWVENRWRDKVTRPTKSGRIYRAPRPGVGVTLQPLRGTSYLAKMGLAKEITSSFTKTGRRENRTPFQILRALVHSEGQGHAGARDVALWQEWARAMYGARQLVVSKGLYERYGEIDLSDDALMDQAELSAFAAGAVEDVYTFSRSEWDLVRDGGVEAYILLLDVPTRYERWEWPAAVLRLLDELRGLPPVPF